MPEYTSEQLLTRWEDVRELKNLMGRYTADITLKKDAELYDRYWSRRNDVCLGVNEGWYDGRDAVAGWYSACGRRIALESGLIRKAFPAELAHRSEEETYGVGMLDYKPIDTPVIEVAEDGVTAKGLWAIRGTHSRMTAGGPQAVWEWGWFAVDFIEKDGEWKIWHMQYLQDILRPCGAVWYGPEPVYEEIPEFSGIRDFAMPEPSVSCVLRERWTPERRFAPSPRVPEPYESFADTFSYGMRKGAD